MITHPLRGVIPPAVTPLLTRDSLDREAFRRLIEHLIGGDSSAVFILGSTGEAPGLSQKTRREIVDCAAAAVNGRVPLLVGITDTAFEESLDLARHSARAGADAVVIAAPYYFTLSQAAFAGYAQRLAAELPLPLYLYNIPRYTKFSMEPETVAELAHVPQIVGIKDSSGDREYFRKVRDACAFRPDFALLCGIEELLAAAVLEDGAHGGVAGGANLCPQLYSGLYAAAARNDLAAVTELQARVMRLTQAIYTVGDPGSSYMRGLKCAVSLAGFGGLIMAEPLSPLETSEQDQVRRALKELAIL